EMLQVVLSNPVNATISDGTAAGLIIDDDLIQDGPEWVSIEALDAAAAEQGSATGTFRITRPSDSIDTPLRVYFSRTGKASFGPTKDYTLSVNGTPLTASYVDIAAGQDHVDIVV